MNHSVCRLCSSETNLISLFKGKNRTNRDYIRKLVVLAVGIEYEANDYFDCICCTCVLQTFNMYVFRSKSLKNQEKLQMLYQTCKKKQVSTKISNIELPDYAELKSIISPWLLIKQFVSTSDDSSSESNLSTIISNMDSLSSNVVSVDAYTQTNQPQKSFNVSVLTKIAPIVCHEYVQCELWKSKCDKKHLSKNQYIQCELLKATDERLSKHKYVQCDLTQLKNDNKCTDKCDNKSTVHHTTLSSIVKAKDAKNKRNSFKDNLEKRKNFRGFLNDSMESQLPLINNSNLLVNDKNLHKTDDLLNNSQLIVNNLLQVNDTYIKETPHIKKRLRFSKDSDISVVENSNEIIDYTLDLDCTTPIQKPLSVECPKLLPMSDIKIEPQSSPYTNLETSLIIKSSPCHENNLDAPHPPSPISSELLQVTGKVEYLRSCVECAAIIYTKAELVEHRKSHMKCYLCKKKFPSIKKTKEHMNSDCIRKLCSKNLLVYIPKLEDCEDLKVQYKYII